MPYLAKKWTRENPYIYIDHKYPRRMVLFWENGKMVETTYARWLWVKEVGPLAPGLTLHHINEDKMDDRIENYEPMTHSQHTKHHKSKK